MQKINLVRYIFVNFYLFQAILSEKKRPPKIKPRVILNKLNALDHLQHKSISHS